MKVTVLGAGSWGVALAMLAHRAGNEVALFGRDGHKMQALRDSRRSPYFPEFELPPMRFSCKFMHALDGAELVVCALPSASLPMAAPLVAPHLPPDAVLVSGTKGLHPTTLERASQIWIGAGLEPERFVALSGPNLAREIVAGVPTSSVVASASRDAAEFAQRAFDSPTFRVYTQGDLLGVELGGALKNIVAIAAGIGDGRGFGDNAKAALMTRFWREMARLATALGARENTLWGLSGLGDLLATCSSPGSRNHQLGVLLGQGETLGQAQAHIAQTIEGVHTCRAALQLGQERNVFLPLTRGLAAILWDGLPVEQALRELVGRPGRSVDEDELPQNG